MTRLRFLLGLVGVGAVAQKPCGLNAAITCFGPPNAVIPNEVISGQGTSASVDPATSDVTRVPLGSQGNAWTVTHAKRPANGQCPVCGTLNEVVFADEYHPAGHPVGTYCDWCSAMFVQRVEKPY